MSRLHYSHIIWASSGYSGSSNLRGSQIAYPKHWSVLCWLHWSPGHHLDHLPAPLRPPQHPHLKEKKKNEAQGIQLQFTSGFDVSSSQTTVELSEHLGSLFSTGKVPGSRRFSEVWGGFSVRWLVGACKQGGSEQKWEISPGFDKSHAVADSLQSVLIFISSP